MGAHFLPFLKTFFAYGQMFDVYNSYSGVEVEKTKTLETDSGVGVENTKRDRHQTRLYSF